MQVEVQLQMRINVRQTNKKCSINCSLVWFARCVCMFDLHSVCAQLIQCMCVRSILSVRMCLYSACLCNSRCVLTRPILVIFGWWKHKSEYGSSEAAVLLCCKSEAESVRIYVGKMELRVESDLTQGRPGNARWWKGCEIGAGGDGKGGEMLFEETSSYDCIMNLTGYYSWAGLLVALEGCKGSHLLVAGDYADYSIKL